MEDRRHPDHVAGAFGLQHPHDVLLELDVLLRLGGAAKQHQHENDPPPCHPIIITARFPRAMAESRKPAYKRILLKISGEALMGTQTFGINPEVLTMVATEIADTANLGIQVAVVVGGGNIFRGEGARGMDRATGDYVGMLATVMNAVTLQEAIERRGVTTRVQSAVPMSQLAE